MIEDLARESIKKIPPYVPGKNPDKSREDVDEIDKLSSNENQLGPSPKAVEALIEHAMESHLYPDFFATDLREKIAEKYEVEPKNVITACGSSMLLELLGQVFVKPGDEVVFCVPTFMLYASITSGNDGIPVMLPLNEKMEYDLDKMLGAINEKTKMVMVCNPNNPTGTALCADKILDFIERVPENVIIVIDEAYIEFSDRDDVKSFASLAKEKENLIVLRTFSKIYGLAGLRVGYGIASPIIVDLLSRRLPAFNTNKAAIEAAKAALDDDEFVDKTKSVISQGRQYLKSEFEKMGFEVYDSQTNFIYVNTYMNTDYVAEKLEEHQVIIRGNFKYTRITIGTMRQNKKVIEAFKNMAK